MSDRRDGGPTARRVVGQRGDTDAGADRVAPGGPGDTTASLAADSRLDG